MPSWRAQGNSYVDNIRVIQKYLLTALFIVTCIGLRLVESNVQISNFFSYYPFLKRNIVGTLRMYCSLDSNDCCSLN